MGGPLLLQLQQGGQHRPHPRAPLQKQVEESTTLQPGRWAQAWPAASPQSLSPDGGCQAGGSSQAQGACTGRLGH